MTDVTGLAYPQLMQKLVLQPFGMKHSTYEQPLPDKRLEQVATPYRGDGTPVMGGPHVYPEYAAAGLWTTPSDLATFVIGIGRALSGKSKGVVSEATLRTMLTPAVNQQAIGFVVGGHTERKWLNHGGSNDGYRCFLLAYQDGRDGAIVMTNSDSGDNLLLQVMRTIAHEYAWPDYAPPERVIGAVDPASFDRFVGAYQFDSGIVFTFWRDGTQIRSRIQGQPVTDLFPMSEREYFAKVADARIGFTDGGSAGTSAVLYQNDREQTVKRMDSPQGRAELDWSTGIEKRLKEQTPGPGSEVALRHLIEGIASGNPAYDELVPDLAQATRSQLLALRKSVSAFGPLQTISFKRVLPGGWDVYDVKFEGATREFRIVLEADGRVFGAFFSP